MKLVTGLTLASALIGLSATPALAGWHQIGQLRTARQMSQSTVRGPQRRVRAISLSARGGNAYCASVRVTYRNGNGNVFSGWLDQGRTRTIDLPGRRRHIERIDLNCTSHSPAIAILVAADTVPGRYMPDRRDRWGVRQPDAWHRWSKITTERFEGRHDREMTHAGVRGRRIGKIALRPLGHDASCSRISVRIRNGNRFQLNADHVRHMERGLFYVVDLPGDRTDVARISLSCHGRHGRDVSIEVWGKHGR